MSATESLRNLDDYLSNLDGRHPCATLYASGSRSGLSLFETLDWVQSRSLETPGRLPSSDLQPSAGTLGPAQKRLIKPETDVLPTVIHDDRLGYSASRTEWSDLPAAPVTANQIRQLLGQSRILLQSNPSPLLAIAGLLNAGKTSLVAGFLSSTGRNRLLIGESNLHGTHRFIIWLPEAWRRDAELWKSVRAQLETVFDYPPEDLSDEPALAAKQYNAIDAKRPIEIALATPLIATDPALDQWNIGLIDCPDIQTGITASEVDKQAGSAWSVSKSITHIAEFREKLLSRALHIASAFVVVASANSLQDEYVDRILASASTAMPGLKKILAVNRVPRRYSIVEVADEIRHGYAAHDCWRFYMAYHFDGPIGRERLPSLDLVQPESTSPSPVASLPAFFRIDHSTAAQPRRRFPRTIFLSD